MEKVVEETIYVIGSEKARSLNANLHIYSVPDGKGDRKEVEAIGCADCPEFFDQMYVIENGMQTHKQVWGDSEVLYQGSPDDIRYIRTLSGYNVSTKAPSPSMP